MKVAALSKRTFKEIIRDPLSLVFGIGLPLVMMVLFYALNNQFDDMPDIFSVNEMALSMSYFGLTFLTLFLGMLVSGDRDKSFIVRLKAAPVKNGEFIAGYFLPMLVIVFVQIFACIGVGAILGLKLSLKLLPAIAFLFVDSLLFIGLGILFGTLFSIRQVGGISSIIINVTAIFSGIWFPLDAAKGGFKIFCNVLPFVHGLDLVKNAYNGSYENVWFNLVYILGLTAIIFAVSSVLFKRKLK